MMADAGYRMPDEKAIGNKLVENYLASGIWHLASGIWHLNINLSKTKIKHYVKHWFV